MKFEQITSSLGVNSQEFTFQFQSHPDYPSALAFSDTLNFLNVKNDAYELQKEYWGELPEEFITIYNDTFALVKKEESGIQVFSDDVQNVSKEQLYENSTDFVLLFEKEIISKEKRILNFYWLLNGFLIFLSGYTIVFLNLHNTLFNLLSILGLFVSFEIIREKFGDEPAIIKGICRSNATDTTAKNDCNKIMNADKTDVLGLKLSDLSLLYFSALLVLGIFSPFTDSVLKFLSFVSCLVIAYSLVIQIFIEKVLCKVCLLLIGILIGQIIISSIYFGNSIKLNTIALSVLVFLVLFFALVLIKNLINQKEQYRKSDIKNLKFKRNYGIFKRELLEKKRIFFQNTEIFRLGKPDAKLHISLVSNPYCGFCKEAHHILEKLLQKYPDDISAQIRFNYFPSAANTKYKNLINDFLYVFNKKNIELLKSVDFWFEHKNEKKLREYYNSQIHNSDLTEIINISIDNESKSLNFTPVFLINGYAFPDKYDREDIFYFMEELLEDEEITNEA
ncbi:vitamin K epoxide reductase family protein [Epilithonimonas sp.]|uniref:vitamin K epoxide reductase family protein n=1 Tax=Epilithonimonas sp. TaxID=2894511 RepID=UPI0028A0CEA9|nr:vitamin K epoxide reductase family protein [Epilithonimonas sp.]